MKKIFLVLIVVFSFLAKAEFNDLEDSIRRANFYNFKNILQDKQLTKTDKERLLKLNDRTIQYYKEKLYAAKSLFTFSRRQSIMFIKSLLCACISSGALGSGIYLLLENNLNFNEIIGALALTSCGFSIASIAYFLRLLVYPDKLQKQYNQSLEIEQELFKCEATAA